MKTISKLLLAAALVAPAATVATSAQAQVNGVLDALFEVLETAVHLVKSATRRSLLR